MKIWIALTLMFSIGGTSFMALAADKKKSTTYRKTQEVSFDETDIDGQVRSPDGAYLLQKRGVKFQPLYKVNEQFEENILDSVEYLR
jgi:hypothetical protein